MHEPPLTPVTVKVADGPFALVAVTFAIEAQVSLSAKTPA